MARREQTICPLCGISLHLRKLVLQNGSEHLAYDTAYTHLADHLLEVGRKFNLSVVQWEKLQHHADGVQ